MIGQKLSHFRVIEQLGAGGMGVVYRARDERLERDVAIKVLPTGAVADEAERRQFRKEALALSKLNHPNIAMVFDFDTQDGVDFLVEELVSGVTLSDRIAEGPLPEEEVARVGHQLAEGLQAAHREGVIHRDIKPGNLRLTPEGRLKILDFGLAKLARLGDLSTTRTVTVEGAVTGTLPYMSPEQLRGEPLDGRSDIYSAGAVLYEMACGRKAFPQENSPALIAAILSRPPKSPQEIMPGVSADLERIALRCLEKDPEHRYGSAEELAGDLRQLERPESQRRLAAAGRRTHRPARAVGITGAGVLAAALVALALNVGGLRDQVFGGGSAAIQSLAVLPLVNLSHDPEQEYFSDGMTDELITRLAGVSALRVISRSSTMEFKGAKEPVKEIASRLRVGWLVQGSVLRSGEQVRIAAQLVDARKDALLWADSYQSKLSDVLGLQSDVARSIVENVRVRVTPNERTQLARAQPVDPKAQEAFLKGHYLWNQFTYPALLAAIDQFGHAIEIDPTYAPAYSGLADAYCAISSVYVPATEAMPRARAAALRALAIDSKLASAHASLAYVEGFYEWNWKKAERDLSEAIALNPGEATAHQFYAQLLMLNGRMKESQAELARARDIDPLSSYIAAMESWPLYYGGRFHEAAQVAAGVAELDPKNASAHFIHGMSRILTGDPSGIAEVERATQLDDRPLYLAYLGWARARSGDQSGARKMLGNLLERSKHSFVQPYCMAVVQAGLGQTDSVFAWLERGVTIRSEDLLLLGLDPGFSKFRDDPRFRAIMTQLGLPNAPTIPEPASPAGQANLLPQNFRGLASKPQGSLSSRFTASQSRSSSGSPAVSGERPSAWSIAVTRSNRRRNFPVAARRCASGSVFTNRARFTTAKRRSPISSRTLPSFPSRIASSTSVTSSRSLASTPWTSLQSNPTDAAFSWTR